MTLHTSWLVLCCARSACPNPRFSARADSIGFREPEKDVLYQVIAGHLETFLERLRYEGHELPRYVIQEFYKYLDCGILQRGFARCACETCGQSFTVAFSC